MLLNPLAESLGEKVESRKLQVESRRPSSILAQHAQRSRLAPLRPRALAGENDRGVKGFELLELSSISNCHILIRDFQR